MRSLRTRNTHKSPLRVATPFSLLAVLIALPATPGTAPARDGGVSGKDGTAGSGPAFGGVLEVRGRWVVGASGRPVGPDAFRRGLQPSGLLFRRGLLWSAGDQRSQYPGHVFPIDPATGRLAGEPLRLVLPEPRPGENPAFGLYRSIPRENPDFEGIALDPGDPETVYGVTEDKVPWVAVIRLRPRGGLSARDPPAAALEAHLEELTEIRFPADLRSWRDDPNFRVEGLAVAGDGKTLYLAFERADDDLPRLYRAPLAACRTGKSVAVEDLAVDFSALPPRVDKARALLNVNDIQFLSWEGKTLLLAVARDQERLLVVDIEKRRVARWVDLDLRDPEGAPIHWVSPEGLATDAAGDRLWVINDPDSVRGNYRRRDQEVAAGAYADYVPLLFELRLSRLFAEGL